MSLNNDFIKLYSVIKIKLCEDFLLKFSKIKDIYFQTSEESIRNYELTTCELREYISTYKPKIEDYLKLHTPNFNIFKILGLHRKEVITHTSLIAYLLSIVESHNQSNYFLKNFLKIIGLPEKESENENWYILKECDYIDLRIVNNEYNLAICIENKIDTTAHSGQLSRYFDLWKKKYKGGQFIYLTINGENPPNEGFDDEIYSKTEILKELRCLSYKYHIKTWIEKCLNGLPNQKLYYTIQQYLELINTL